MTDTPRPTPDAGAIVPTQDNSSLANRLHYAAGSDRLQGDWRTQKLLSEAARALAAAHQRGRAEAIEEADWPVDAEFQYLDKVTTPRAPFWAGTVCGWYRNSEGRLGFNVEADAIPLAIHNYPQSGLRALAKPSEPVDVAGETSSGE